MTQFFKSTNLLSLQKFQYLGPVQPKTRAVKTVPKINTHPTISQVPIDQLFLRSE